MGCRAASLSASQRATTSPARQQEAVEELSHAASSHTQPRHSAHDSCAQFLFAAGAVRCACFWLPLVHLLNGQTEAAMLSLA